VLTAKAVAIVASCLLGAGVVVGGVVLVRVAIERGEEVSDAAAGSGPNVEGRRTVAFDLSGHATEAISPGVSAPIDLTLTNPHPVALTVNGLRVTIVIVSAPNAAGSLPCSAGDFEIVQADRGLSIVIEAGGTTSLGDSTLPAEAWPRVGMRNLSANQDGCKGALLTLEYSAKGSLG
jgi:hypothetical protein